jgi:hypothetical protein
MSRRLFILAHDQARRNALECVKTAPAGYAVTVAEPTRSTSQNARMWALLTDISEQVEWYGKRLTPEDWKAVFSAALRKSYVVPGLDGGFVVVGQSTSRMSRRELSDLMELISAFGAERNVTFQEEAADAERA